MRVRTVLALLALLWGCSESKETYVSHELAEYLCATYYCNADNSCSDINYAPGCVTKCIEKARQNEEFAKRLACAGDEEPGKWCSKWEKCSGTYPILEDCVELCAMIADCDSLNNPTFGYSQYDCTVLCSVPDNGSPLPPDAEECLVDALSECSGVKLMGCAEDVKNPCVQLFCGPDVPGECALVPKFYASTEACLDVCIDWSVGQSLAAQMCAEIGQTMREIRQQESCAETNLECMDVPAKLPEGALDYCSALVDKCGAKGEGLGVLGKLGYDICAWALTGLRLQMKEIFVSFLDAVKCVENLDVCPKDELALMYCLLAVPEWGKKLCTRVHALCGDEAEATELTYQCEFITATIAGWLPEGMKHFKECVNSAKSCEALLTNCLTTDSNG